MVHVIYSLLVSLVQHTHAYAHTHTHIHTYTHTHTHTHTHIHTNTCTHTCTQTHTHTQHTHTHTCTQTHTHTHTHTHIHKYIQLKNPQNQQIFILEVSGYAVAVFVVSQYYRMRINSCILASLASFVIVAFAENTALVLLGE